MMVVVDIFRSSLLTNCTTSSRLLLCFLYREVICSLFQVSYITGLITHGSFPCLLENWQYFNSYRLNIMYFRISNIPETVEKTWLRNPFMTVTNLQFSTKLIDEVQSIYKYSLLYYIFVYNTCGQHRTTLKESKELHTTFGDLLHHSCRWCILHYIR